MIPVRYLADTPEAGDELVAAMRESLVAAPFVEAEHPRAPAGSKRGGQWIETIGGQYVPPAVAEWPGATQRANEGTWSALDDELTFDGFRPQIVEYQGQPVFSPEGQFEQPPPRGGVWWKASYDLQTGEMSLWVPNNMGGPHHFQMAEALGWENNGEIRDWDRRVDIMGSGYGATASMDPTIDRFGEEDAAVLAKLRERLSSPKVERQLRQAADLAIETEPAWARDLGLAASTLAWDPSKHPREAAGTSVGGRWAKKAGAPAPEQPDDVPVYSGSEWTGPDIAPWEQTVEGIDEQWQEPMQDPDTGYWVVKGNESMRAIAARHEVSAEEYRHLAEARAAEDLSTAYVASRVPTEVLDDIVETGRMKSQFETQTSRGSLSPRHRMDTEENLYSYPPDLPDAERPIYGYMQKPGRDPSWVSSYGEVEIEFKRDVRSRTTFTQGDSLAQGYIPSALNDPSYLSLDAPVAFTNALNDTDVVRDGIWADTPYVEAQIHGGVTLDDIAAVTFPVHMRAIAEAENSDSPVDQPARRRRAATPGGRSRAESPRCYRGVPMRAIAQRGNTVLMAEDTEPGSYGQIVNVVTSEWSPPMLIESILATGYWEEPSAQNIESSARMRGTMPDITEPAVTAAIPIFDPVKHPRHPRGSHLGGQWRSLGGVEGGGPVVDDAHVIPEIDQYVGGGRGGFARRRHREGRPPRPLPRGVPAADRRAQGTPPGVPRRRHPAASEPRRARRPERRSVRLDQRLAPDERRRPALPRRDAGRQRRAHGRRRQ